MRLPLAANCRPPGIGLAAQYGVQMSTWSRVVAACAGLALLAGCSGGEDRSGGRAAPATPIPPRWEIVYSSQSANSSFGAVALAKDEVWVLGDETRPGAEDSDEVLLRLRDGKWDRPALPPEYLAAGRITNLSFVAAPGSPDVWLFARIDEKPKAWHWDGTRWVGMAGAPNTFQVQALAPDDLWAADWTGGFMHHWDGTRWSAQKLSITASSFSAVSSDDIWAAGYALGTEGVLQPAVLHFDGRTWHRTPTPEYRFGKKPVDTESATLQKIVAVAPNEAWAFGDHSSTTNRCEGREVRSALERLPVGEGCQISAHRASGAGRRRRSRRAGRRRTAHCRWSGSPDRQVAAAARPQWQGRRRGPEPAALGDGCRPRAADQDRVDRGIRRNGRVRRGQRPLFQSRRDSPPQPR